MASAETFDDSRGSLRMWLFAIARNLVVDHVRAGAVRPVQPADADRLIALAGGDSSFAESTMTAWTVEEALRRLSEDHRVALVETYLRGRPCADVSADLGVPVSTVRSRVFCGLKAPGVPRHRRRPDAVQPQLLDPARRRLGRPGHRARR